MYLTRRTQDFIPTLFNELMNMDTVSYSEPKMNIIENKENYLIQYSVPGLKKEDLKISIDAEGNLVVEMSKENNRRRTRRKTAFVSCAASSARNSSVTPWSCLRTSTATRLRLKLRTASLKSPCLGSPSKRRKPSSKALKCNKQEVRRQKIGERSRWVKPGGFFYCLERVHSGILIIFVRFLTYYEKTIPSDFWSYFNVAGFFPREKAVGYP